MLLQVRSDWYVQNSKEVIALIAGSLRSGWDKVNGSGKHVIPRVERRKWEVGHSFRLPLC